MFSLVCSRPEPVEPCWFIIVTDGDFMLHTAIASVKLFCSSIMQTVDKAMSLLSLFGPSQPEIGLSELGRMAGFDKAATRRFLVALAKHGFIEQNRGNRKYRLGSAFLRFARIRETTLPLASIVQPILNQLAIDTGETAHASLLVGNMLSTIAVAEPQRATRAYVDLSEPLPLYATASGFACLAFAPEEFSRNYIGRVKLERVAPHTLTSKKALRAAISLAFEKGFGRAAGSFESDVTGTAAAFFNVDRQAIGAVAIAAVATRFNAKRGSLIERHVLNAAVAITEATGGIAHGNVKRACEKLAR